MKPGSAIFMAASALAASLSVSTWSMMSSSGPPSITSKSRRGPERSGVVRACGFSNPSRVPSNAAQTQDQEDRNAGPAQGATARMNSSWGPRRAEGALNVSYRPHYVGEGDHQVHCPFGRGGISRGKAVVFVPNAGEPKHVAVFFLFLLVPLIEIALFIQVGGLDRPLADAGHRGCDRGGGERCWSGRREVRRCSVCGGVSTNCGTRRTRLPMAR